MASTVISKPMRGVVIPDAKPPPTNNKTSDTPTSSSPSSIPSSSSKGSIRADPESQLLLEDNRALHKPSLFSIYYMQLCNSTAILITVPTADEYSAHVGISADLSGVVVGMFPLVGVLGAYPCYYGVKRVGFTFVVAVCAVALVIGSVMYAFAWSATSPALLLCGRALQGFFQYGPGSFDYVAMAVPIKKRTTVMLYNAVATTAGYSVGPFLAFAICKICEAAGWNGSVMNEATGVGWMLALLNGGLFFLAVVVMRNPAPAPSLSQLELRDVSDQDEAYEAVEQKEKRSVRQELKDVNIPAVLSLLYICFTLAAIITVGDVFSVQNAQDEWNWDIDISAVYIGTIMLVLTPVNLLAPWLIKKTQLSDRAAIPMLYGLAVVTCLFLVKWPGVAKVPRVVLFSAGMFFVNGLPSIVRGFAMSLLSKIVPAKLKRAAVTTGQMMFMIGRGVGASLAPLLTADTFPYFQMGLSCSIVLFHMLVYKHLVDHNRAN